MKDLFSLAIHYEGGKLRILDQTLLPFEEKWITIDKPSQMIDAIKRLQVRGAPLIGVAAALSLADYSRRGASLPEIKKAAEELRSARPTAVNLMSAIDRCLKDPERISITAAEIFNEDVELCAAIARHGFELVEDGNGVLTHCNAGALATAGIGTALGIIRHAFEHGKKIHVFVDETRPLLQGARLTTWELGRLSIPHTLLCDNMAASLMAKGKIQKAFVGADRIARNGDFANKIGTYGVALSCHYHHVPFYTAAPMTTVDMACASGKDIPIENRASEEVRGKWALESTSTVNPAFDVTPRELLSGIVLDRRLIKREEILISGLTKI